MTDCRLGIADCGFNFEVQHRDALRKFESGRDSIQVTSPLGTVPGALATALNEAVFHGSGPTRNRY